MILKQLKQLTLSATRRNAHLWKLPRLYSSPAVSQSLTTSKPSRRLSRDDRRILVESFVTEYRAANAGKFPSLTTTVKEVGGGYYIVRNILQELKLRPNAPISPALAASPANDDASRPSSDEVSLQGGNNLIITATHDRREMETASLDKDVDSKCDGNTLLPDCQTVIISEECLKNSEIEEVGTLTQLGSQEPRADHPEGASGLLTETRYQYNAITATHGVRETETAPPNKDVDSKCDSSTHLPENQTLKVADECLKNSETKDEGTLTQLVSEEPKADHLEEANVLIATHVKGESETALPNNDVDSKCDSSTHLPQNQTLKVAEECLKNSETKDEGTLTQLVIEEPKAYHLEEAIVLPATNDDRETETAPPNDVADSKCETTIHLLGSQPSMLSEECLKNSETKEEGKLTHLGNQEPKADHIKGAAVSASVLPTETRQVPEKGDGEVKTRENSSAWSNIISFAKGFANFWRKG